VNPGSDVYRRAVAVIVGSWHGWRDVHAIVEPTYAVQAISGRRRVRQDAGRRP